MASTELWVVVFPHGDHNSIVTAKAVAYLVEFRDSLRRAGLVPLAPPDFRRVGRLEE